MWREWLHDVCWFLKSEESNGIRRLSMSMNEKQIVGESFEDLSDRDMAMLTGRGDDGVAPA